MTELATDERVPSDAPSVGREAPPDAAAGLPKAMDFAPPRWLRNPHVQSILASSGLRRLLARRARRAIERGAVEHVIDCGDGVRLQGFHSKQTARPEARGLVVLLHGWEGSARLRT